MDLSNESVADLRAKVAEFKRVHLCHLPTPLEEMPRLAAYMNGPRLFVKRDDSTGLGLGGNKLRKLEYSLGAAVSKGADSIVSGGVIQSNSARQVAAACVRLGLECHLVLMRGRVSEEHYDFNGNILLDHLYGAIVHEEPWSDDRNGSLRRLVTALKSTGRRPYMVPYGASDGLGAIGYVDMTLELLAQCEMSGIEPTYIVHASGTGGTQAGILITLAALHSPVHCIGIDVDAEAPRVKQDVRRIGREAATLLDVDRAWDDTLVEVVPDYAGPWYGVPDATTLEAIRLAARSEAIALDPVYAGKGMAGLLGLIRKGRFQTRDVVVWIHTGGCLASLPILPRWQWLLDGRRNRGIDFGESRRAPTPVHS